MNLNSFIHIIDEIVALGYDTKTAARFARLIDATPIIDNAGRVLVTDGTRILARLKLKTFKRTARIATG